MVRSWWLAGWLAVVACSGDEADDSGSDTDADTDADADADADADTDTDLPRAANLAINEFMASNQGTYALSDETTPDWIELYNAGDETVDLLGMKLSDKPDEPDRHVFADSYEIPPGGFALLLADGSVELGVEHVHFSLSAGGEDIVLTDAYDRRLDWVAFGPQDPDIAVARAIDGDQESPWLYVFGGTPGSANND